jgi:hypothetical protein
MGLNLLETLESEISDAQVAALGGQLGLPPNVTVAAFGKIKPIVLAALVRHESVADGGTVVARLLEQADPEGVLLESVSDMLASGSAEPLMVVGKPVLQALFGEALQSVVSSLAADARVKEGAMEGLLTMLVPIVLAVIGQQKKSRRLDASGLQKMLRAQKLQAIDGVASGQNEPGQRTTGAGTNDQISRVTPSSGLGKTILLAVAVFALFFFGVFRFINGGSFPGGVQTEPRVSPVEAQPAGGDTQNPVLEGSVPAEPVLPESSEPVLSESSESGAVEDVGVKPLGETAPSKVRP